MKKISNMIRQTLTALLFNTAVAIDGPPSWLWIYEPEKPKLLKDKYIYKDSVLCSKQ